MQHHDFIRVKAQNYCKTTYQNTHQLYNCVSIHYHFKFKVDVVYVITFYQTDTTKNFTKETFTFSNENMFFYTYNLLFERPIECVAKY